MLDETTGTEQDTSPGQSGQSSGSKGGTTSKDKGKVFTDAQIVKIKSDAAAEAGRLRKAAEQERDTLKDRLETTISRLDSLERETSESREAEARDNPDQLRIFQREDAIRKRERATDEKDRDLTTREEQLKSDRADVDKDKGVVSIAYIAAKHGLEAEELESLGISDHDTLEKVAEKLAAGKTKAPEGGEGGGKFEPDSSVTTGSGEPTQEQLEKMTMSQYAAYAAKRDAKK